LLRLKYHYDARDGGVQLAGLRGNRGWARHRPRFFPPAPLEGWAVRLALFVLAVLALLAPRFPADAAESAPFQDQRGVASLVSDSDSVAAGRALRLGLRLRLAPGWHTYGRDPGDAGEPPDLHWSLPAGVRVGEIAWPPAQRQVEGPLVTYGYTGEVLLPVALAGASGALAAKLHATWLACSNICVPEEADFALALPAGDGAPGAQAALFPATAHAALATAQPSVWLGQALLLAFLGGVLLNLMPCVFPVLAMKAAGLAKLGGAARHTARRHAAAYTLGVVVSFCAIGMALLLLRVGGQAAGWGFQFAHPAFVAAITWVVFCVGLNFSGVFEVHIPGLAGRGRRLTDRGGVLGSFATGGLAVLVATPCTTPFMGAALAAALAAPPATALAIFAALGAGLAAPYALLATVPGATRLLPRPGTWMIVFRELLAFPMYGAALWLLWVVGQEAGPNGALATGIGALLLGFAAWALGRQQRAGNSGRGWRVAALASVLLAVVAGGGLLASLAPAPPGAVLAASGTEPFSAARLAELRAQNRPVFIDMTAAWCVTCLVNERVVLDRPPVRAAFAAAGVTLLRGDWTRQDAAITDFLRRLGHDGVPLYVLYPRGDGAPLVLPQILTEGTVLGALRRVAG
jgi:thiol:disulfide interchange protein